MQRRKRQKIVIQTANVPQRPKNEGTARGRKSPQKRALLASCHGESEVAELNGGGSRGHKLVTPHPVIEPVFAAEQERKFAMQRRHAQRPPYIRTQGFVARITPASLWRACRG